MFSEKLNDSDTQTICGPAYFKMNPTEHVDLRINVNNVKGIVHLYPKYLP